MGDKVNKYVIVGANRGIGFSITQMLLARDPENKVLATYRKPDQSSEFLELAAEDPDRLIAEPLDLTWEAGFGRLVEVMEEWLPQPGVIINCAGLLHDGDRMPEKSIDDVSAKQLMDYFRNNTIGAMLLARCLDGYLDRKAPTVFACLSAMVGSIGDNHLGGWYGYRSSKAALNQFIRTLSIEWNRTRPNATAMAIHPGTTDTRLSRPFQVNIPEGKLYSPETTAERIMNIVDGATPEQSGSFVSWDGAVIPW